MIKKIHTNGKTKSRQEIPAKQQMKPEYVDENNLVFFLIWVY
jgi:hypothetical protein